MAPFLSGDSPVEVCNYGVLIRTGYILSGKVTLEDLLRADRMAVIRMAADYTQRHQHTVSKREHIRWVNHLRKKYPAVFQEMNSAERAILRNGIFQRRQEYPDTSEMQIHKGSPGDPGCVYLAFGENNLVKIGKTNNAKRRLKQLEYEHGYLYMTAYYVKKYHLVEFYLHRLFEHRNIRGEWFELSESDLKWTSRLLVKIAVPAELQAARQTA